MKLTQMKKYYDTEHDRIVTTEELEREYRESKKANGTDAESFSQYLGNCMVRNNGTLELYREEN